MESTSVSLDDFAKKWETTSHHVPDTDSGQYEALKSLIEQMDCGDVRLHASDFPKTSRSECLSVVTLTTEPPIIGHGSGSETGQSRDAAAKQLLSKIVPLESGKQ